MKSRRKFTKEFKQTAVRRLKSGQSVAEVARALEVHPSDLHRWRRELQEHGERAFSGRGQEARRREPGGRVGTEGRPTGDGDRFFKASLAACRGAAPAAGTEQRRAFYRASRKRSEDRDQVERGADVRGGGIQPGRLLPFSATRPNRRQRTWTCGTRSRRSRWSGRAMEAGGSPQELKARGWEVNRKRVQRLMREDNLLCVAKRKFVVTTDSGARAEGLSQPGGVDDRSPVWISSGWRTSPISGWRRSSYIWQ